MIVTYDDIVQYTEEYVDLAYSFHCNQTNCENPKYFENYLQSTAILDFQMGKGTTFIAASFNEKDQPVAIKGFITLKTNVFAYIDENEKLIGSPAVEIAELAVDQDYIGQGIGADLIAHALKCAILIRNYAGVRYLLVCATKQAVEYYKCKSGIKFAEANNSYIIPREHWNVNCIPLYMILPQCGSQLIQSYFNNEDDDFEDD